MRFLTLNLGRLLLAMLAPLAACDPPGNVALGPPPADPTAGAYGLDTLSVRVSTVWRDSVPTSGTNFLLVGQYRDPRLGLITATGYARLGWNGPYTPAPTEAFDSLALELRPAPYRYADTTRLQSLYVRRLAAPLVPGRTYFSGEAVAANPLLLNQGTAARAGFRAGPSRRVLRVRLADALGRALLLAGQQGRLGTEAELAAALPGLALAPGPADDAALLILPLAGARLRLFTHAPAAPAEAHERSFGLGNSTAHYYQVAADRRGTLVAPLSASNRLISSRLSNREAYLAGALGLQLRLEIPYLTRLRVLSPNPRILGAEATLETVAGSGGRGLGPPATLYAYLSGRDGQRGPALRNADELPRTLNYLGGNLNRLGLETGRYQLPLAAYCQAVLDRRLPNDGLLLAAAVPQLAERVVLGGEENATAPVRLRVYLVR